MPDTTKPRFKCGDLVMYMGSQLRYQGWLFTIQNVLPQPQGEPRYGIREDGWGVRLDQVRQRSLRGPDD
ncbi:hypothetical protein [Streptomyces sp. 5-6(2022)]|uniref:hypothetical protein n=1 Tax=Streptomyces sp. 5-6(2022) TaxID=2936510 RepID=UPI0023B88FD3|nr:hypothetical protein [Streptomyces sp. 5-6(2022)]